MKAFLIDPHAKEIMEINVDGFADLRNRIGEDLLAFKDFLGDRVFTGSNAFMQASHNHDVQGFFMGPEHRIYAGYGIVLGVSERSTMVDGIEHFICGSSLTIAQVQASVKFKWSHEL